MKDVSKIKPFVIYEKEGLRGVNCPKGHFVVIGNDYPMRTLKCETCNAAYLIE